MNRLPSWFRQEMPDENSLMVRHLISEFGVHTVCQEAKCPNINYCFKNKKVTFMILGQACTRNCRFCNISGRVLALSRKASLRGTPLRMAKEPPMFEEAYQIKNAVEILGLRYVVITSVARDDLSDGGAAVFAKTIELIHRINKDINPVRDIADSNNNLKAPNGVKIEVLVPDFQGKISSLQRVLDAGPFVVGHNIETVRRLYRDLRPMADYQLSLNILRKVKESKPQMNTKSSLMLGLGEKEEEVIETMRDLRKGSCDILTLGQYLAPSPKHYAMKEFISPAQFKKYEELGLNLGFKSVLSGPKVRSSYQAEELNEAITYGARSVT